MLKKFFTLSLTTALLLTACNKNTNQVSVSEAEVAGKYSSIATITFPTYSLDYIFTNDYYVSQTISPTVSLALGSGMSQVNGSYTMYYTTAVLANGTPDFSNPNTTSVTFTSGNASNVTLSGLSLNALGNSPISYKIFVKFRANSGGLTTINTIYTIDIYKRAEFSAPVNNTYGVTPTSTAPIFINPNASSGLITLNYSVLSALVTATTGTNYDLVAQVIDQASFTANETKFLNKTIASNMNFTYDFSDLMMSYGPLTVNAYFVKNGLSSAQDPTASRVTLAVQPINIYIAWVNSLSNGTTTGTVTNGVAASGVSFTVNYTAGTGGNYPTIPVSSTGVTGLTATLTAGTLGIGNGSLTFNVTGTASAAGTASFAINFGGSTTTYNLTVN